MQLPYASKEEGQAEGKFGPFEDEAQPKKVYLLALTSFCEQLNSQHF